MSDELSDLRKLLDEVDARIVEALAARQQVVARIGEAKLAGDARLRDLSREQDVLTRLVDQARAAGVDPHLVTRLFREILDHSVRRQQQRLVDHANPDRRAAALVVGYQGTDGANSHIVAQQHFGTGAIYERASVKSLSPGSPERD